ncbi:MAG TPA: glycan-binding surface protein [Bacteroidaceae bacterium]|nr:glycan-binding surface protein [Bacteroidaceae bacterium]
MMKSIKTLYKLSTVVLATVVLAACNDVVTYNDNYDDGMTSKGAPVISGIYDISDNTVSLSEGSLEQMLKISGENLSHVESIYFNDVMVDLSEVYATADTTYLPVPRTLPTEVTNILTYTTELGTTTRDFKVQIPSLKVKGLYNAFALPGDTVQVIGSFFDLYGFGTNEAATFSLDGAVLPLDTLNLNSEYMAVILPKDAPDNATITVSYPNVDGQGAFSMPYRNIKDIVWDLSDPSACGLWAGTDYITDGSNAADPQLLYKDFIRVQGSFSAWSWNNLPCGGFNLTEDAATNFNNYQLSFEVSSKSATPFYDSGSAGYIFQVNGGSYAWNPSAQVSFNTYGEWETVSIPLSTLCSSYTAGWTNLFIILQPNGDWNVDHSFANIRIEPIIN